MKIATVKIKQYSSTFKYVVLVDGIPVCIARGIKSCNDCISYLMNGEPKLKDGKIMKILDKVRGVYGKVY